jgi:serpin B
MNKTLFRLIAMLILVGVALSGCAPVSTEAKSDQTRVLEPAVPADALDALVGGNNTFALSLYQSLRSSNDGNLFYSPYSISLALAMTYGGARGETEAQMAQALHFDLTQEELHAAFNRLDLDLARSGEADDEDFEPMQLNIANAVWAQQDHPFLPEYLDLLALNYGAGVHLADFTTQADPTAREINRWVSDQTNDRIQDIISPGTLDELTRMVLVNAIYFKADWMNQFDADDTEEAPFYLLDGSDVTVDMMSNDVYASYLRGETYQAVELLYAGGTAAMDIIMPDEGQFAAFEAALDWGTVEVILDGLQRTDLQLEMPKFTFRSQFALAEQLAALGMRDAFDRDLADFSAMDGLRDLYIGSVIHQAFVAVDEEGTEAAAATVVIMMMASMPVSEVELTIDHPFFFLIRDLSSGQILFAGRVLNPGQ